MTSAPLIVADPRLERSWAHCREVTRAAAGNFYHGLKLLPGDKRRDMFALYAYMRALDDLVDEPGRSISRKADDLSDFRRRTHDAIAGQIADEGIGAELWPAFSDMVRRRSIPATLFDDAIDGQWQDVQGQRYDDFEQLRMYCYRVAGVVGLASVHIWGHEQPERARSLAIDRGVAFQLTNILRDLAGDLGNGRCYLPADELEATGLSGASLLGGGSSSAFEPFMRRQIARAEDFYERSAGLESLISADSRPALVAMTGIYRELLRKIAESPVRVLNERVSLSTMQKLKIAWRAMRGRG